MDNAKELIVSQIKKNGSISVEKALEIALYDKKFGYYSGAKNDLIGNNGDFVTSPQISQLFGEVIGIWCLWTLDKIDLDKFSKIHIIELGGGSGFMMMDLLNIMKNRKDVYQKLKVSFLEISNFLISKQKQTLNDFLHLCSWYQKIQDISSSQDCFTIVIANEFFDALPITQLIDGRQRNIILDKDDNLIFEKKDVNTKVVEVCQHYKFYCDHIKSFIKNSGVALIIDYGDWTEEERTGDTLQAVKKHKIVNFLNNIGSCDISHQVNFFDLSKNFNSFTNNFYTQKDFLCKFGIHERLEQILKETQDHKQIYNLKAGVYRLLGTREMGTLFKVLQVSA
jgi:NADH dehydrogenase [ubiquinone] 1 alpha subcomplex assembly factor 7